jgi:folate-binding protein YgfZ
MNFHTYLETTEAACVEADEVVHFGDPEREREIAKSSSCKAPLSHLGVVQISGPDAREFIHAQFTTDCAGLQPERSQLSAWCSPQGRVLFLFMIVDCGDEFEIIIPRSEVGPFVQRLSMYVLRAQVVIRDLADGVVVIGISVSDEGGWNPGFSPPAGRALHVTGVDPSFKAVHLDESGRRHLVYGDAREAPRFWRSCPLEPVGREAWTLLEIYAGLPSIIQENADQFLPQSLNLDLLDGVSFRKGCYPGQEVITRVKSRGTVKHRTVIARAPCVEPPAPGTRLYRYDDQSGNSAGQVLVTARESADRVVMLVVVELDLLDEGTVCLADPHGPQLTLTRPPYPFG